MHTFSVHKLRWLLAGTLLIFTLGSGCASCEDEAGTGGTANNGGVSSDGGGGTNNLGGDAGTGGSNNPTSPTDTGGWPDTPFEINDAGRVTCDNGLPCQCDNGIDDDGDGQTDGFDPECTGPYDNDEGSFATGIPGDNKDPNWQDCFFDGNSGSGNDGCRYRTECLTGELPQSDPDCQLSQMCIEYCARFTPNGCDCFGCCEIFLGDGTSTNVVIGTTCDFENIDDCQTCTPSTQCGNGCGECELCFGKTVDDLPESCSPTTGGGGTDAGGGGGVDAGSGGGGTDAGGGGGGGPGYTCDNGEQVCSAEQPCTSNFYCQQGCCVEIIL